MTVNGMRAQHELLCDLAIAETARDAGEDLTLTAGHQDRLRLARMVRRPLHRCQRFAACADDGIGVTVPGEVRAWASPRTVETSPRGRDRRWGQNSDATPGFHVPSTNAIEKPPAPTPCCCDVEATDDAAGRGE